MLKIISTLFALLFLALGLSLGLLNPTSVTFDYYFNQVSLPLSILLGVAFILGVLVALIYSLWSLVVLNIRVKSLERRNSKQLNELIELRKSKDETIRQLEVLQQDFEELDKKNSDLIMLADNSQEDNSTR